MLFFWNIFENRSSLIRINISRPSFSSFFVSSRYMKWKKGFKFYLVFLLLLNGDGGEDDGCNLKLHYVICWLSDFWFRSFFKYFLFIFLFSFNFIDLYLSRVDISIEIIKILNRNLDMCIIVATSTTTTTKV